MLFAVMLTVTMLSERSSFGGPRNGLGKKAKWNQVIKGQNKTKKGHIICNKFATNFKCFLKDFLIWFVFFFFFFIKKINFRKYFSCCRFVSVFGGLCKVACSFKTVLFCFFFFFVFALQFFMFNMLDNNNCISRSVYNCRCCCYSSSVLNVVTFVAVKPLFLLFLLLPSDNL